MKQKPSATSKTVREWFEQNPQKVPTGAETSVQKSCKGRISSAAIDVFNRESGMEYAEGNVPTVTLPYVKKSKSGARLVRFVDAPITDARRLAGAHAGLRGVLSMQAREVAGQKYAKRLGLTDTAKV